MIRGNSSGGSLVVEVSAPSVESVHIYRTRLPDPMLLEVRETGRKTPNDGKLEITEKTARRLWMNGTSMSLAVGTAVDVAHIEAMACSCGKGSEGHEHYFVRSELLRQLRAGETVCVELTDSGTLEVARPHPLAG